jgi:chorismate synthase
MPGGEGPTAVAVRELRRFEELRAVQELAGQVWGFEDRQLPSTSDLQVVHHVGGLTAGAFVGSRMVGFVHGLPRTNLSAACHHSHMLAVRPEFQGRGISVRLKLFQRKWCLKRGIGLVTWTYDPLLIRNARLNLVRLGAQAWRFLEDAYGRLGGIYGGLPTDRFEVCWRLKSREAERAARGLFGEPTDAGELPRATSGRHPASRRVAVEIPAGAPALYTSDPALAAQARASLRKTARSLFTRGYEAVSIAPCGDRAFYVFERRKARAPR